MREAIEKFRGEFVSRLNGLILLQGAFIILGFGIAVFLAEAPENADTAMHRALGISDRCSFWLETIAIDDRLEATGREPGASRSHGLALPDSLRTAMNDVSAVQLYLGESGQALRRVPIWPARPTDSAFNTETREHLEASIKALIYQGPSAVSSHLIESDFLVMLKRTQLADGTPAVLMVTVDHGLYLTDRGYLLRVLFILFGAGLLVSVLLVLLVRIHFQLPLKRLRDGLERWGVGDKRAVVESHEDNELRDLSRSINSLQNSLVTKGDRLKRATGRLKELSASLVESQMFLAALVDRAPLAVFSCNPEGEILLFNRQAASDFGCDPEEALGRNIGDYLVNIPDDAPPAQDANGAVSGREIICRRTDGTQFPACLVKCELPAEGGQVAAYLYMLKDISESAGYQDMMIRIDRYYTRGEMAGDIAHEINNYLAILMGNLELMPLLLKRGDADKIEKKLDLMRRTAGNIANFTDGLMDGHTGDLEFAEFDLNQLVLNVIAFLQPQNRFDGIEITTDLSSELGPVELDGSQVQQLLVNLIYNAAEAVAEINEPGQIHIETFDAAIDDIPAAGIRVLDNGLGVREDRVDLMFKKRFTTKPKGHGIGLVTCQRIVETHGGTIEYEKLKGARFSVRIPLKHSPVTVGDSAEAARPVATA